MVSVTSLLLWGFAGSILPSTTASVLSKRTCPSNTVCQTLTITWAAKSPDGYSRNVFLVNGQFPGPRITMTQGQRALLTVVNNSPFNQTVHWHGIAQVNTSWSDGVPGVSQYGIPPNGKFLYNFTATESGSYWYHSHSASHLSDGLYGPLVINAPASVARPFSAISTTSTGKSQLLAAETASNVVMVADWAHRVSDDFMSIAKAANVDMYCLDSVLINGKGSSYCLKQSEIDALTSPEILPILNGTKLTPKACIPANITGAQGPYPKDFSKLPKDVFDVCSASAGTQQKYEVDASKGYAAFHFYNSGIANLWSIAIDEHSLWIYAVDGRYIQPQKVDGFIVEPGARISAMVPLNRKAANYTMRFSNPGIEQILFGYASMSYKNGDSTYVSKASINKVGQNVTFPFTSFDNGKYQVFPAQAPATKSDRTYHLDLGRFGSSWQWTLSGAEAYNGSNEAAQPLLFNYNSPVALDRNITVTTKYGEWVDMIIHAQFPPSNPEHALHKHGNKAYIIGLGQGEFTWPTVAEAIKAVPGSFNLVNPPYRDGFLTPGAPNGPTWLVIRYKVEVPGAWIFHCHMQPHVAGGMAINILDAIDKWPTVPPKYLNGGNGF